MDTCYSYWVGGSLSILGRYDLVDTARLRQYVFATQDKHIGGMAKWPDYHPDPLHSYLGIAGMSMAGVEGLQPLDYVLNLSQRASRHLRKHLTGPRRTMI